MKIVAGMGRLDDYEKLVMAGADEIFCGFVPNSWNIKYGNVLPLNRREVLFYHVQIGTYEDMKILAKKVEKYDIPVTITFNALYYTKEQLTDILEIVTRLTKIGFREYIIADVNLIRLLFEKNICCNIHISGELGEWNSATVELFNKIFQSDKTKISRIIFHRQNLISDMDSIINTCNCIGFCNEFEAFCMNERCHYTGGFCNSLHADEMVHLCKMPYVLSNMDGEKAEYQEDYPEYISGESGCGLCALMDLQKAGVTHLKVVGRGESAECMVRDIQSLKEALSFLENSKNEAEFKEKIINNIFNGTCGHNCYYNLKW